MKEKIKLEIGKAYYGRVVRQISDEYGYIFYIWDNELEDADYIRCTTATFKRYIWERKNRENKSGRYLQS